ncbi:MAG: DegT/DnrJ/EryC1/StrS family aminotransferase, partial [Gemmatimonadota bacterium]
MGLRRQLPAYSPVRLGSLLAGATGALGVGDPIGALGRRLTAHFGTPDHLLVDSGTSGLRLAIEGARSMHGGRTVALPAYCCYDVATAAIGAGAGIRLYDIDPITLGPDWPSLEGVLSPDVSSVVAVHLYGVPVDVPRMAALAARVGAVLIEDAAQGVGGSIDERPLGVHGSLGVLSFGRGKGLTGGGGGAVLATDDIGRAALMAVGDRPAVGLPGWRGLLRLAGQWLLGRPSVYGI